MKLLTLLAIVLTVQCMAQDNLTWLERYSRIRDTFPLVDTCPEGTTWMNELIGSGCEVVAGCYTKEQQKEAREWFYKCEYGGSDGVTALKSLYDFAVIANGKTITGKLDKNKSNDVIVKFYNVPETPITIEDIERWVEHCYNDSTPISSRVMSDHRNRINAEADSIKYKYINSNSNIVIKYKEHPFLLDGAYRVLMNSDYYTHKDPNDIVGLLKWLKDK